MKSSVMIINFEVLSDTCQAMAELSQICSTVAKTLHYLFHMEVTYCIYCSS